MYIHANNDVISWHFFFNTYFRKNKIEEKIVGKIICIITDISSSLLLFLYCSYLKIKNSEVGVYEATVVAFFH